MPTRILFEGMCLVLLLVDVAVRSFVHGCGGYTGLLAHGVCKYVYVYMYTHIHMRVCVFVCVCVCVCI